MSDLSRVQAGALYHVTARGNRREMTFRDAEDRPRFLDLLGREVAQQGWLLYAYCTLERIAVLSALPASNAGWPIQAPPVLAG